jgi:anti-anti-sigma regulatory factor
MTEVLPVGQAQSQPADRCPYRGPFTREFQGCPTFRPAVFPVADSTEKLLGTAITCSHLRSGEQSLHHFYPRCAIGTPLERLEWLGLVGPERLAVVRAIDDEFDALNARYRDRLLAAKAEMLAKPQDQQVRGRVEDLLCAFLDSADQFLAARADRLADVGLPADRLSDLVKEWSLAWLRSRELTSPASEDSPLSGVDPVAAALIRLAPTGDRDLGGDAETVYDDGKLRIARAGSNGALSFVGEIDASNVVALDQSLLSPRSRGAVVEVDFASVTFCDLGGLRAIVRASTENRIVLKGMNANMERALRIAGWADLPNLELKGHEADGGVRVEA